MEKLGAKRRSGPSVEVSTEPDEATTSGPPGTVPGYAPGAATGAGVGDEGGLHATGEPVSRDVAAGVDHGRPVVAWDLLGGIALVAAAAIGLLLLWRRRHPTY